MAKKKSQKSIDEWTRQNWRDISGKPGGGYAPDATIRALKRTRKGRSKLAAADRQVRKDRDKDPQSITRHGLHSKSRTA